MLIYEQDLFRYAGSLLTLLSMIFGVNSHCQVGVLLTNYLSSVQSLFSRSRKQHVSTLQNVFANFKKFCEWFSRENFIKYFLRCNYNSVCSQLTLGYLIVSGS